MLLWVGQEENSVLQQVIFWYEWKHPLIIPEKEVEVSEKKLMSRLGNQVGLGFNPSKFKIPYSDLKPKINKFLHAKWQQCWNNNIHKKLLGRMETSFEKVKKRTRHYILVVYWSYQSYFFILKQEQQTQYLMYQTPCTVKHFHRM